MWKTRKPPVPLPWEETQTGSSEQIDETNVRARNMQVWSLNQCANVFATTVSVLKKQLADKKFLMWDKDDPPAMDFVTACANVRAHIFSIKQNSRFTIKSIAGNIIPAIASANAMIAGVAVLYAMRALEHQYDKCPSIYLRPKSMYSKFVLNTDKCLEKPNPACYVCSPKPFVTIFVNVNQMTVKELENEILKKNLNMVEPDVVIDGKGVVVISSEEGEMSANDHKKLADLGILDGTILKCDDFFQNYELTVAINHYEAKDKEELFKIIANRDELKAKETENGKENGEKSKEESKSNNIEDVDDDDDLLIVEEVVDEIDPQEGSSTKRRKLNPPDEEDDDVCIVEDV